MKLAICMPTLQQMPTRSAMCLTAMVGHTIQSGVADEIGIKNISSAYIDLSRTQLAVSMLQQGADALFWLDHDHTFPVDSIVRLLNREVPIVGCGYRRRTPPEFEQMPSGIKPSLRHPPLAEADYLLGGFTLVRRQVYEKLTPPFYRDGWGLDPARPNEHIGEDIDFSARVKAAGFELLVDMALTREIGHLYEGELRWDSKFD